MDKKVLHKIEISLMDDGECCYETFDIQPMPLSVEEVDLFIDYLKVAMLNMVELKEKQDEMD